MKTHPSRRHFGLPLAIVASAHAILFLGFSTHRPTHITHTPPAPADPGERSIELYPEPVDIKDPPEAGTPNPARSGDPASSSEDRPTLTSDSTQVSIPLEQTTLTRTIANTHVIPISIGDRRGISTTGLARLTDLDFVPHALSRMSPAYPTAMKAAGVTGTVTLTFTVDESGRVVDASVVNSTHWEFEQPALRAIFHWRFEPGKRHGQPTSFRMSIPLNFVLEN